MRIGRYRFRPPWWGVILVLAGVTVFAAAGIWQIQRGQAKASMLTQRASAHQTVPVSLLDTLQQMETPDFAALYGRRFRVPGHYDGEHQILLDNQVHDERAGEVGYNVWTPLVLADGLRLLVDRGWIPLGPGGRSQPPHPPAPRDEVVVSGLLKDLPQPGMRLGSAPVCDADSWPRVLNYPSIDTIRCLYSAPVANGLLLLDADRPHGFERHWQARVGMPPMRHYGYAVQWFAMALAAITIFLIINLKRMR